jgi:hypothetical protein
MYMWTYFILLLGFKVNMFEMSLFFFFFFFFSYGKQKIILLLYFLFVLTIIHMLGEFKHSSDDQVIFGMIHVRYTSLVSSN